MNSSHSSAPSYDKNTSRDTKSVMDPENCPVCLDIFYEPFHALPCEHLFCKLCFKQICARNMPCPYCRQPIIQWKYNRDEAIKVKAAFPECYVQKVQQEKDQKVPIKRFHLTYWIPSFGLFILYLYLVLGTGHTV